MGLSPTFLFPIYDRYNVNPMLHGVSDQRIMHGRGEAILPSFYVTPEQKVMGTPNLEGVLVFTKTFGKIGFELTTSSL